MDEIKFSIIIPIYNIEGYIQKCVKSILSQTFQDYEIILVNDGSTDNSGMICDEISKQNNKIKVIHQKNGGLSSARNTGIRNSQGKFLMFIDGDDFLNNENCLKKLNESINRSRESDIIQYKMKYYYEQNNKYVSLKDLPNLPDTQSKNEKISTLIKEGCLSVSACDKIVKRKVIEENQLFFEEGLLSEDIKWSLKLYHVINNIFIINEEIYVYRQQRANSITTKTNQKSIESLLKIIQYWYTYRYSSKEEMEMYYNYLAYQYVILLTIINNKNCSIENRNIIYSYKELLKYEKNYKVKLSNKIFKVFGIKKGAYILKIYLKFKNKGLIKI